MMNYCTRASLRTSNHFPTGSFYLRGQGLIIPTSLQFITNRLLLTLFTSEHQKSSWENFPLLQLPSLSLAITSIKTQNLLNFINIMNTLTTTQQRTSTSRMLPPPSSGTHLLQNLTPQQASVVDYSTEGSSSGSPSTEEGKRGGNSAKLYRFLIFDAPTATSIDTYIRDLLLLGITDVVRVCEPTYESSELVKVGITCHDWSYEDGNAPPREILEKWMALVALRMKQRSSNTTISSVNGGGGGGAINTGTQIITGGGGGGSNVSISSIGVHCVAGLGRAPCLVALALMEFGGLEALDAVAYVRERRRGAINARQMKFIENYKPTRSSNNNKCIIQ